MKEWQRTIILVVLLAALIITFVWLRTGLEDQAIQTLQ
jgi:hypothetical protein